MLEYYRVNEILDKWCIASTIFVGGSARVSENGTERQQRWYKEARAFAQLASKEGGAINKSCGELHNVIATGAGPGIMEAANRGAYDIGAPSIGLHVELPFEAFPNPYATPELTFVLHYFSIRKLHLTLRAKSIVMFPGGFGTIDELFELLTLIQTTKSNPLPILLVDEEYWSNVINLPYMLECDTIGNSDLSLVSYVDTGKEAWTMLKEKIGAS